MSVFVQVMLKPVIGFPVGLQVVVIVLRRLALLQSNVVANVPEKGPDRFILHKNYDTNFTFVNGG